MQHQRSSLRLGDQSKLLVAHIHFVEATAKSEDQRRKFYLLVSWWSLKFCSSTLFFKLPYYSISFFEMTDFKV